MAATPQQIAQAKQLAQSRGYDPNLVDADNADRANSAFPTQGGGYTGGAGHTSSNSPVVSPGAKPGMLPAPPPGSTWGGPNSNPGQTGGPAGSTVPNTSGNTGVVPPGGTPGSVEALNKVVEPETAASTGMGMSLAALGAATGAVGNQESTTSLMPGGGMLRSLGQRRPVQDGLVLRKGAY